MTNRRGYPRFDLPTPADAVLRVVRDVSVTQVGPSEFVCLGTTRCSVGEVLTLEVPGADTRASIRARVVSSRPVAVNGALRNELRLVATGEAVVRREDPSDGDARRGRRV